jgi:hypothetical protein
MTFSRIFLHKTAITVLAAFHVIMVSLLIHLTFFAAKGPRYTADDGEKERQERIAADLALVARIDELSNLLAERAE